MAILGARGDFNAGAIVGKSPSNFFRVFISKEKNLDISLGARNWRRSGTTDWR